MMDWWRLSATETRKGELGWNKVGSAHNGSGHQRAGLEAFPEDLPYEENSDPSPNC